MKVNWDDSFQYMDKSMFETTNQKSFPLWFLFWVQVLANTSTSFPLPAQPLPCYAPRPDFAGDRRPRASDAPPRRRARGSRTPPGAAWQLEDLEILEFCSWGRGKEDLQQWRWKMLEDVGRLSIKENEVWRCHCRLSDCVSSQDQIVGRPNGGPTLPVCNHRGFRHSTDHNFL